jgi:hypothetical protein
MIFINKNKFMQKKLYFLDESEKNRILNLHENRTQKQYLDILNNMDDVLTESKFWGISNDGNVLFTSEKIFVVEKGKTGSFEYGKDSLPYIISVLKKKSDNNLLENVINTIEYLNTPRLFLNTILENLDINYDYKKNILKEWDKKYFKNINIINESFELIVENKFILESWNEIVVICEQVWDYFQKGLKKAGEFAYNVGSKAVKGVSKIASGIWNTLGNAVSLATKKIIVPILQKGILPALRWIRCNASTRIGIISEVILSMFPTVVVVKAVYGLFILLDIYEIVTGEFDNNDPCGFYPKGNDYSDIWFGVIFHIIGLLLTGLAAKPTVTILKRAAKTKVIDSTAKTYLRSIIDSLPKLKSSLTDAKKFINLVFPSAGNILSKMFNGIDTFITMFKNWITKTFKLNTMAVVKTVKSLGTKKGLTKLAVGGTLGYLLAEFFKEKSLKKGDKNEMVKNLQIALNSAIKIDPLYKNLELLPETGIFEEKTEKAVKHVQKLLGVKETGIADSSIISIFE